MTYQNLNHALKYLRRQISESIPYALSEMPTFSSPEEAFKYLRSKTTYKKDPKGVELFQTLPTLFKNNYHGVSGAGDCDCFTIAAIATLLANGYTNCGIVLVGRSPLVPVHIYAYVDIDGKRRYFDLTNKKFDYEREYPFRQEIPFKINSEEKNMILQLADSPRANNVVGDLQYIHIPSMGKNVREDYFYHMKPSQYQGMLAEEGYSMEEIAELSGRFFKKRMAKKREKLAFKKEKKAVKNEAKANKPKNLRKVEKRKTINMRVQGRNERGLINKQAKLFKAKQPEYSAPSMPQEPEQEEVENFNSFLPMQPQEPEEEIIEVESEEVMPEEEESEMAALFEGETRVLGESVPKMVLWGLASLTLGFAAGYGTKSYRVRKSGLADFL